MTQKEDPASGGGRCIHDDPLDGGCVWDDPVFCRHAIDDPVCVWGRRPGGGLQLVWGAGLGGVQLAAEYFGGMVLALENPAES